MKTKIDSRWSLIAMVIVLAVLVMFIGKATSLLTVTCVPYVSGAAAVLVALIMFCGELKATALLTTLKKFFQKKHV